VALKDQDDLEYVAPALDGLLREAVA